MLQHGYLGTDRRAGPVHSGPNGCAAGTCTTGCTSWRWASRTRGRAWTGYAAPASRSRASRIWNARWTMRTRMAPRPRFERLPLPDAPEGTVQLIKHLTPGCDLAGTGSPARRTAWCRWTPWCWPCPTRRRRPPACPAWPDCLSSRTRPAASCCRLPRGAVRMLPPGAIGQVFPGVVPPAVPSSVGIVLSTADRLRGASPVPVRRGPPGGRRRV